VPARNGVDELFARIRAARAEQDDTSHERSRRGRDGRRGRRPRSPGTVSRTGGTGGTVGGTGSTGGTGGTGDSPPDPIGEPGPVFGAGAPGSPPGATHDGGPGRRGWSRREATVDVTEHPPPTAEPTPPGAERDAADADLLRQRDAALEGIERTLARRLKRVLADEQNEVLDLVRRHPPEDLDELVPPADEHVERYAEVALAELESAAGEGAAAVGGTRSGTCRSLAIELGRNLVDPLRVRMSRSINETSDVDEVTARLRALYREWKGQRIGLAVRHYTVAAYAAGALDAVTRGDEVRWLVDRTSEPCPDADDNALARGVRKGEVFPTGDRGAPAHPGCRCLVVPASGVHPR
jgi:hypothetical protein